MVNFTIEAKVNKTTYSYIDNIFQISSQIDGIAYVVPTFREFQEFATIVLAWKGKDLIGFIWNTDTELNEVFGMVVPEYRRQGVFNQLLSHLASIITKEVHITFYGRPEYSLMSQCAHRLGYEISNEELLMVYEGTGYDREWLGDVEEDEGNFYYYIGDELIGSCSLYETDNSINIYEVLVLENFRGNGYGEQIIRDVLWNVCNSNKQIILQVAAHNKAAVRCYEKCGFVTKDSVVFYTQGASYEKRN